MLPTTVDAMIRTWKIARLSSDSVLGYPKINILARCALYGTGLSRDYSRAIASENDRDADLVQRIVGRMPQELRKAFEAKHLGLINGKRCRALPHYRRAEALQISKKTYIKRWKTARTYVQNWLSYEFDTVHDQRTISIRLDNYHYGSR